MNISQFIDHTVLKPETTQEDIEKLCSEAIEYNFKSVCVNPHWVALSSELLKDSKVLVCTVVGFPLGANTTEVKVFEAKNAVENGAEEIDMVINIGEYLAGNFDYVLNEINEIKDVLPTNVILKVIVETALLTKDQIKKVTELVLESKADFIKTSTGFSTSGAKLEDIEIMKSIVKDNLLIKASGGVASKEDAKRFIEAGTNRIGTSRGTQLV